MDIVCHNSWGLIHNNATCGPVSQIQCVLEVVDINCLLVRLVTPVLAKSWLCEQYNILLVLE